MLIELRDPETWSRFKQICRLHLSINMKENDMDHAMLTRVVNVCKTPREVWTCVSVYNETYFRELIQSFADLAVQQVKKA